MILMENVSDNAFDNTDNMIPFKELQGKLAEKNSKECSPIRAWRAFTRLRQKGLLRAGTDWKDKEFTDKHNHYVNLDRFLEEVKELKNYSDIRLKSDTSITSITPPLSQGTEEEKRDNPSSRDNTDNTESDNENASDNAYREKYIAELERDKKRLIDEKGEVDKRFVMVFSGYDRIQKELYASEKEVTKLRLQLGSGASHLSQSAIEEEEQHDEDGGTIPITESAPPPEGGQGVVVIHDTPPSESPQDDHHDDFTSENMDTPSSEPETHTGQNYGEAEGEELTQDYGEGGGVVPTTYE